MKAKLTYFFASIILMALLAPQAHAWDYPSDPSQSRERFGVEVERFTGGPEASNTQGWMLGIHSAHYPHWMSNFNWGYGVYVGTPRDGATLANNNLTYGGLTLGYDGNFMKIFTYDLRMLGGYGYGNVPSQNLSGESFVTQPTFGLGVVLVKGWRLTFNAGYLYMPSSNGFSGMTYGIRLEHKTESADSKGVDY